MTTLGIHHLMAPEISPLEFIDVAAQVGAAEVSLFVNPMAGDFPLVTWEMCGALRERLRDTGIRLANLDPFALTPQTDVADYGPALELAAELRARSVTALLMDTDEGRVTEGLTGLCEQASANGLRVSIEFMAMSPAWNTLEQAVALVDKLGRPSLGVGVDLLHLVRAGDTPDHVRAVDPGRIAYAQICDGADLRATADYATEAGASRMLPGEGVFPVEEFLRALPTGIPLEIEAPVMPRDKPAVERIRDAVEATRQVMAVASRG